VTSNRKTSTCKRYSQAGRQARCRTDVVGSIGRERLRFNRDKAGQLTLVGPGLRGRPANGRDEVMNAPVGGLFTSRINQQLREVKGYTYGMFSGFTAGREDGLFAVRGSVRTPVTGAALGDLYKELDAIRARPLGAEELGRARNAKLRSLPGEFDTNRAVTDAYADAWAAGLPPDHVVRLPARYAAVTAASAFAAARRAGPRDHGGGRRPRRSVPNHGRERRITAEPSAMGIGGEGSQ